MAKATVIEKEVVVRPVGVNLELSVDEANKLYSLAARTIGLADIYRELKKVLPPEVNLVGKYILQDRKGSYIDTIYLKPK